MTRSDIVSVAGRRLALLLSALTLAGCAPIVSLIVSAPAGPASALETSASPRARALIAAAVSDLGDRAWVDAHVHVIGGGNGASGIEPRPGTLSWWSPLRRGRALVYLRAAGVEDPAVADEQCVARLLELVAGVPRPGRCLIYALDRFHDERGRPDPDRTPLWVPNEYVVGLASARPDALVAVASIHPDRPDALDELERQLAAGVRCIKWLPNAQGIDPASPRCDAFYRAMARHRMVLLSHTGRERAVDADELQHLGNPLRLRRALDHGVRVIALHAASDGDDIDLDDPERRRRPSFDLLLRLLDDPRYDELLFVDLASVAFPHHLDRPLRTLLGRVDLHRRVVHGSDWPLVAIDLIAGASELADRGFLSPEDADALEEIRAHNPLLYDLVLKRTVRHPESGARFPSTILTWPEALHDALPPAPDR